MTAAATVTTGPVVTGPFALRSTVPTLGTRVTESAVRTHVKRILAELALRDRVQAVILAYGTGLVRPGEQPPATG